MPGSRIFSNWGGYNSDLYVLNCVLEGSSEYSEELNSEYVKILRAFSENSVYSSGFSFEDGYTPSLGFREGSTAFVALARREYNFVDTSRFRNFLTYLSQSYEP